MTKPFRSSSTVEQAAVEAEIIRIAAVASPLKLYPVTAILGIQAVPNKISDVAKALEELTELRFIALTTSVYDFIAEAVVSRAGRSAPLLDGATTSYRSGNGSLKLGVHLVRRNRQKDTRDGGTLNRSAVESLRHLSAWVYGELAEGSKAG